MRALLPRLATLLLLGCSTAAASCFIESPPPPASRYTCDTDADCEGGEVCASGLCQVPCTLATFAQDCDASVGYIACYNGFCAHLCEPSNSNCTPPQTCISIGEIEGMSAGICGEDCSVSGCPTGETCLSGVCLTSCVDGDDAACPPEETCLDGVCLPSASF